MNSTYQAGIWASKYRSLPRQQRDQVNQKTNAVFAQRTGVKRKLDPRHDRSLCDTWLRIRDEVMAGRHAMAQFEEKSNQLVSSIGDFASNTADFFLDRTAAQQRMPWMDIARAEHKKGVIEFAKEKHNPEIMKYIRSCPDLYATKNKATYTEREGEEGVKWCSAFVNWCMKQAGYSGTNSARALSWKSWGKPLSEPRVGAIVVTSGSKYRHVAFIDEAGGKLKMLGGNQQASNGKGDYNQVSFSEINYGTVVAWRWPA